MTAIHQVVPTLADRDAVGAHCLAIQGILRAAGYRSEVYAGEVDRALAARAHPVARLDRRTREPTWLLYHASIGSPVGELVERRAEPLVVDYHNITPAESFAPWEPAVAVRLAEGRRQLARLAQRTTLGLADSAFNAAELRGLGYAHRAVVPILLDPSAFRRVPDPATVERLRAGAPGTRWLFVGRIAPNKAQHDVVRAFAVHRRCYDPDARLALVGGSSSHAYQTALVGLVDSLGLTDAVELTGSVSDEVLAAHYAAADVFVCLSDHEGFCVPLLEAMHRDVPIVAFGTAAVPETLGEAGLVLRHKAPALVAAAVDRVRTDARLRDELVARGRDRLSRFGFDAVRAALLDALRGVVPEP